MTYASQQDMIDRFGEEELIELTDRARTGAIDVTVMTRCLEDADSEIDSYLSGVYTFPLATVPDRLNKLACDVARYELYGTRATEQVVQRYKDAIAFLQLVVKGVASLGLDELSQQEPDSGSVGMNPKRPSFDSASLGDYNTPPRLF